MAAVTSPAGPVDQVHHVSMYTPNAYGGHARYTHELLSAIADRGPARDLRVSLITSTNLEARYRTSAYPIHAILDPLRPRAEFPNLLTWALSRFAFYFKRDFAFVRFVEGSRDVDAVHVQDSSPWLAMYLYPRLRKHGVAVFETVHNITWNTFPMPLPAWLPDLMNRRTWRSASALIVHTASLRDQLAAFLGPGHPPIFVAPHGTWNHPEATPTPSSDERLAARRLVAFGVINQYKGLHVLLEAMRELPDVSLVIAGSATDARYLAGLRRQIAALPDGQVTLIDRYLDNDELPGLFASGTLAVLPYVTFSSQSGVLHDAISWGVPVVGTDVGAIGESIRSWEIGEVAPPNDAAALAASIRTILEPDRYEAAIAAIAEVHASHGWNRSAELTIDAYEAVLHGQR